MSDVSLMQKTREQDLAVALKDAYVDSIVREAGPEVMAAASSNINEKLANKLAMEAGGDLASGHIFLDEAKEGKINDSDPSVYFHRGGNTHQFPNNELGNPLEGGAGERQLLDMDPEDVNRLRNQFDQYQKQLDDQRYGTGNLAMA